MKVALINPYPYYVTGVESTLYPPMGILYIGSYARAILDSLLIYDANALESSIQTTVERIESFKPDVIGISVNIATARSAHELIACFRKKLPSSVIVVGGPLPTVYTERWAEEADAVVVGEGEVPFRAFIERLACGNKLQMPIPGVFEKGKPYMGSTYINPEILPFPAYENLEPQLQHYTRKARAIKKYMAPIITSRGCPFACDFCDRSVHGTGFRPRTAESVLKEVDWLHSKFGVNQLDILDDNFTLDMLRAEKILDGLIKRGGFSVNCQNGLRADRLTPDLVKKMKEAGVFKVGIGIESGSPEILKRVNKKLNLDSVLEAIKWFRQQKITVHGYFIIGFPFESESDINKTLQFAKQANPHFSNFSFFTPIAGTKLYNELLKSGSLTHCDSGEMPVGFFRLEPCTSLEKLTPGELNTLYKKVWRGFYIRPSKIIDIIGTLRTWGEILWVTRITVSIFKRKLLSR